MVIFWLWSCKQIFVFTLCMFVRLFVCLFVCLGYFCYVFLIFLTKTNLQHLYCLMFVFPVIHNTYVLCFYFISYHRSSGIIMDTTRWPRYQRLSSWFTFGESIRQRYCCMPRSPHICGSPHTASASWIYRWQTRASWDPIPWWRFPYLEVQSGRCGFHQSIRHIDNFGCGLRTWSLYACLLWICVVFEFPVLAGYRWFWSRPNMYSGKSANSSGGNKIQLWYSGCFSYTWPERVAVRIVESDSSQFRSVRSRL